MSNIITARRLWDNGELAIGSCSVAINCRDIAGASPRNAWLTPTQGCLTSTQYALNLAAPDPIPAGTLLGVWVETASGTGMVIDAISVDAVIAACNACCGGTGIVSSRYDGIWPTPPPPLAATYTIERVDGGGDYAYQRMSLDYWPGYISGTFNKVSHDPDTGTTTYTFQAYTDPTLIGTDTLVSESNRTAISNPIPTPAGGQVLVLTFTNQNGTVVPKLSGANAAALVSAASGNTLYSTWGTWSYNSTPNTIQLVSSTLTSGAISVEARTPAVFTSNDPGTPTGSDHVELNGVIDGVVIGPFTAATVAAMVTALNGNANYSKYGTWSANGTRLVLTSAIIDSAQLVLVVEPN